MDGRGGRGGLAAGLVALALAGAALGALPHLIHRVRDGSPAYVADSDELLYLAWSRAAVLHGAPRLVDAVHRESGPMMHPWLLFVPPDELGHALDLGLTRIGLLWRALAGAGIALGAFVALRPLLPRAGVALAAAAVLMFEPGFAFGQLVQRQVQIVLSILRHSDRFFGGTPYIMPHLRVVTPGLAIPFLLVQIGLIQRARARGGWKPALAAGVATGLLFHTYFYFWTAAVPALVLAWLLDRPGRRTYATVLVVGGLIGLPAIVAGALVKARTSPDWLHRTDHFVRIGRLADLEFQRVLSVLFLTCTWPVFRHRRELLYLWCATLAGIAMRNHQIVTRLQIENFHYVVSEGVPFSLLVVALVLGWAFGRPGADPGVEEAAPPPGRLRRVVRVLLPAAVVGQVALGFALRGLETTRSAVTLRWDAVERDYRADALPLPAGAVFAGDEDFSMFAPARAEVFGLSNRLVEYSSEATNEELDERLVLNLYLSGTTREEAEALVRGPAGTLSRESDAMRDPDIAERQRRRRLAFIAEVWDDPWPLISTYDVTHLVLNRDQSPPAEIAARAQVLQQGRRWTLWAIR